MAEIAKELRALADNAGRTLSDNSMMPPEMSGIGDAQAEDMIDLMRKAADALDAAHKRIAELEAALSNLLRCEYDGQGLTDCIDNQGGYYQSADLAKQIDNAESLLGLLPSLIDKEDRNG